MQNTQMSCGSGCWFYMGLWCVGWWLITSGLVMVTWNHVLAQVTKVKAIKYWHAAIAILTVSFLLAPGAYSRSRHMRGVHSHHSWMHSSCGHGHGDCSKGECERDMRAENDGDKKAVESTKKK